MYVRVSGLNSGITSLSKAADEIAAAQKIPLENLKNKQSKRVAERNEYNNFSSTLSSFKKTLDGITKPSDFAKFTSNSSHPDVLEAVITGAVKPGTFELEVDKLASKNVFADIGFPDPHDTAVGFGFMGVEDISGNVKELVIDPGSTLTDVADKINKEVSGVKAQIINSGIGADPFKLVISSEKTGNAAKVILDPDTTFLNFDEVKKAADFSGTFENISVSRATNQINDLVEGLKLNIKKAEPGTKVSVSIDHDIDGTKKGIADFVTDYNKIVGYIRQQSNSPAMADPSAAAAGKISDRGLLRSVSYKLQNALGSSQSFQGSNYQTLAQIGISTNAKTGELVVDEQKLKQALEKDFNGVTNLFTDGEHGGGLASKLSNTVKQLQATESGMLGLRQKNLDRQIAAQDLKIERETERAAKSEERLRAHFQNIEQKIGQLESQENFMSSQFNSA